MNHTSSTTKLSGLVILALVLGTGCSDLVVKRSGADFDRLADVRAFSTHTPTLIVQPPFFSGNFASHEVFEKTHTLCTALSDRGVPTVAPWEYRIFNPDQGVVLGSDLTHLLHEEEIDPYGTLRVELRVISLGGSSQVAVGRAVDVETREQGEVHIRLHSLRIDDTVAEVVIGYAEDPLQSSGAGHDRLPGLTAALREAARQLQGLLDARFTAGPAGAAPRSRLVFNPRPMFELGLGATPPVNEALLGLDAMERLALSLTLYQSFWPDISMDDLEALLRLPGGLRVLDPGTLAGLGLQSGDYVVTVNGHAALGPQALARPFLLGHGDKVRLEIMRGDKALVLGAR